MSRQRVTRCRKLAHLDVLLVSEQKLPDIAHVRRFQRKGGTRTMGDSTEWTVAFSHFSDFVQNLPILLDESDVEQYHYIIGLFENALDSDLSRFKISEERMKSPVQNPVPCWQTKLPAKVERAHFVGQIWHFAQFLRSSVVTTSLDSPLN